MALGVSGAHAWWSPDGNTLYFISEQDEFSCIWAQPLDPVTKNAQGPAKAVQHFHGEHRAISGGLALYGYAMTADKHYFPLGEAKGNIWLAEPAAGR